MNKRKIKPSSIFLLVGFIISMCLLSYPTLSDYYNSFHHTKVILSYSNEIATLNTEQYSDLIEKAHEYNKTITKEGIKWYKTDVNPAYFGQLNVNNSNVMGYINIPKIDVKLSIFHGTDESVLQTSIGHLENTSLPVGGKGTHAALSGHRGLPSAKLFSELNLLAAGDIFTIHILNETLTYEVDQMKVVLPHEVNDIQIDPEKDYVTLITCTPYGINTHRILVRGHRIKNIDGDAVVRADAMRIPPLMIVPFLFVPMVLFLILYTFIAVSRQQKRKALYFSKILN